MATYSTTDIDSLTDMAIRLERDKLNICMLYGDCQGGKTNGTIAIINNTFTVDIKNDGEVEGNTLVYVGTNANIVATRDQFYDRLCGQGNAYNSRGISEHVDVDNIKTINNIDMIDFTKNAAIVSQHNSICEEKFINKFKRYKNNYSTIIIVGDEADQGQDKGFLGRLAIIQEIYNISEQKRPYIKVVQITATLYNLVKSIEKSKTPANIRKYPLLNQFIDGSYYEFPIIPKANYFGAEQMITLEKFKIINFGKIPDEMTEDEYRELVVFKEISELPDKYKRYGYVIMSRLKANHQRYAKSLLDCGFNVVIVVNSDGVRQGDYPMVYRSTSTQEIKYFNIPWSKIVKMANNGELSEYSNVIGYNREEVYQTSIKSAKNINIIDVINLINFPEDLLEGRLEEYHKYCILNRTVKFPNDMPRNNQARIGLSGCDLFDRGTTLQDPSTDTVFTMGAQLATTKTDSTNGAKDYQRFGRMNGNITSSFNRLDITPIFLTEVSVLENIMTCRKTLVHKFACAKEKVKATFEKGQTENIFKTEGIENVVSEKEYKDIKNQAKKATRDYIKKTATTSSKRASGSGSANSPGNNTEVPKKSAKGKEKASIPSESKREENANSKYEEVKVPIDEKFIENLKRVYNKKTLSLPGKIMRILKEKEKQISIQELHSILQDKYGYESEIEQLKNSLKNGSGISGRNAGFWNYSAVKNDDWVYMPKKIKEYLE
jgi:hypothetical protein